ncbi:hypothetical protein EVB91_104 [Rhizobium phage RHph_I1_18]|nr:hypothetical protein EVB91_104 [Rhizobium phage RHph_I1_18]
MPTYTFKNTTTNEEETRVMTMSERSEFLSANPHYVQLITSPNGFIAGHGQKPNDGFRDMLREMKKANPGSTINTF